MNEGRGESDRMVEGKEDYGVMRMHRYLWTIKSGASFEIVDFAIVLVFTIIE